MHKTPALLCLVSVFVSAQPNRTKVDDALTQLDAASIKARRSGGTCRAAVYDALVEVSDRLDAARMRARPRTLSRLNEELSDLHSSAVAAGCSDEVLGLLSSAMETLEDARFGLFTGRRADDEDDAAVAQVAPLTVSVNEVVDNAPAVRVSLPQLTLRGMKGQAFKLAAKVRAGHGPWSQAEVTPTWSVPAEPFVWKNAWSQAFRVSQLAAMNDGSGRFIVRVSVLDGQGAELGFREKRFELNVPPPAVAVPAVVAARDCGTGADLGCTQTRDGAFPVERAGFVTVVEGLKAEKNEKKRAKAAGPACAALYLTAAQFSVILDLFSSDKEKLDVAQALAHRVVNLVDAQGYAGRFRQPDDRARYTQLLAPLLNPNAAPKAWRVEGEMDNTHFTFEAPTKEAVNAQCRTWKESDIRLQGFIMRLSIKGGRSRSDMLNTDKACNAVTEAASPLY